MPTLQEYMHALSADRDLSGGYLPLTSTTVSANASQVICSSLIDSTPGISARYANSWIYGVPGGSSTTLSGIQRTINSFGLDAATGTLQVTRAFGSVPATAHKWEIYWRLPAIRDDLGHKGLRECINEALRKMVIPCKLPITATTDKTQYLLDTDTYPWLRDRGRISDVLSPRPLGTENYRGAGRFWDLQYDSDKAYIEFTSSPYSTGQTFYLDVKRPACSHLKIAGTWSNQTSVEAGLTLAAEEAEPPLNDLVAVARAIAFETLAAGVTGDARKDWEDKAKQANQDAAIYKFAVQEPRVPAQVRLTGSSLSVFR